MPDPIEYHSPPPPSRWSVSAVVGFALCLGGPLLGLVLGAIAGRLFGSSIAVPAVLVAPFATGIALCSIGLMRTTSPHERLRGNSLAQAGIAIAILWIVIPVAILAIGLVLSIH